MTDYRATYKDYSPDALLEKRALGEDLADEAHQAIEAIFQERGETLPPKPSAPVLVSAIKRDGRRGSASDKIVGVAVLLIGLVVIKMVAPMWGLAILASYGVYWIFNWLRRLRLPQARLEEEDARNQIAQEGLTEIMECAASGNIHRIRELAAFGGDVNAQSLKGATALMYAVRNNHLAVVKELVAMGADASLHTDKGSSAVQIARKFGNNDIVAYLEAAGATGQVSSSKELEISPRPAT